LNVKEVLELGSGRVRVTRLGATRLTSARLTWDGFLREEHSAAPLDSTDVCHLAPILVLQTEGALRGEIRVDDRVHSVRSVPGQLTLLPARLPHSIRTANTGQVLTLSLDPGFLAAATLNLPDRRATSLAPKFGFDDPLVRELMLSLRTEAERAQADQAMYAEMLATTIAVHLANRYSVAGKHRTEATGYLDKARVRQVLDYMREHLTERVTLRELARQVGLSPFHFSRRFRRAMGQPPHEYLIDLRLERARELLFANSRSLAEIGIMSGFCDQSHFARHFKRKYGKTPAEFSRAVRRR